MDVIVGVERMVMAGVGIVVHLRYARQSRCRQF